MRIRSFVLFMFGLFPVGNANVYQISSKYLDK